MKRLTLFLCALGLSMTALAAPAVKFNSKTVTVQQITPGSAVAVFSVANEPDGSAVPIPLRTQQALLLQDDDRDGVVSFNRERVVPAVGLWVAVDVETGQWTVQGGPGFEPVPLQLADVAKKDNA